jgi:sugar lactone lactonase YvrE
MHRALPVHTAKTRARGPGVLGWVGAALGAVALLACASAGQQPPAWESPGVKRVWPLPPDPPRVEFVGEIRSAADLGKRAGPWQRLVRLLFGDEPTAMIKPVAVARSRGGVLVVADPGVPTVHFFDLERRRYHRLARDLAARLHSPVGVAIDDAGRAYVADSVRAKVFVFDRKRELVSELGGGLLERPTGLSLSPAQDRLYVVDTTGCRVFAFDLRKGEITSSGGRGVAPGEFNAPTYIGVAPDGTLAVSDSLNFRVQRLRPDGTPIGSFGRAGDGGGDFARPKGIGADTQGRLYVVDAAFENVQIFDPDGTLLLSFGGPGTGPGELFLPSGLFLDSSDTIWVADSFNGRVQVFRLLRPPG